VFDKTVEGRRQLHQGCPLFGPGIGDAAGQRGVRDLVPQLHATPLQPDIQRRKIRELRHGLPKPVPGILHGLLNLPLLPPRSRVAEAVH